MINGSENWNIVRVHGLSATQLQMIRVYLQGHAYDWCQNKPNEWSYAYRLIGIVNRNWYGTPLQDLHDYYLNKGREDKYAHTQTARTADWLLWQVIVEDECNFGTQPNYKRKYWWVR